MNGQKIWKIFMRQDADEGPQAASGEPTDLPRAGVSRRTFIEMIGFSAAAIALAGCRAPEQKIVPYLTQPMAELTPGVASWYASACAGCSASCGTLVKVRDGRPIKLEGNPDHPLTSGGLCAVAHAMVFGLYDSDRLRQPMIGSKPAAWDEVDNQIIQKLANVKQNGGKMRVVTPTLTSPASRDVITSFLSQFSDGRHITYDAVSNAAIREAHLKTHKIAAVPSYKFDKAKMIVSFGADFLGTWIAPVQFTRQYTAGRDLKTARDMSRHVQFESRMSLAGSNADRRIKVSPAEEIESLLLFAKLVAAKTNTQAPDEIASFNASQLSQNARKAVEQTAGEIIKRRGESLVVSGSNDTDAQVIVNFINEALGNYSATIDLNSPSEQRQSSDASMVELVREMSAGEVAVLIVAGVNPVYDYSASNEFTSALAKVPLKISLSAVRDETSSRMDYICPQSHFLESWNDAEPVRGTFSLVQPTIAPLFQTRSYQESLLCWTGDARSFYEVLRARWSEKLFPQQNQYASFDEFWDQALHDGAFVLEQPQTSQIAFIKDEIGKATEALKARSANLAGKLSVALYEKIAMRDGAHANNPWLQELPDPITKITWDNYASLAPALAARLGIEEGQVVRISKDSAVIELPAHIQPGQHDTVVAVALGYGRTQAGKAGNNVGVNAYPFVPFENGTFHYLASGVSLEKTAARVELAATQRHHTLDGRDIIKELSLENYISGHVNEGEPKHESKSIWKDHPYGEHKWGLVVDLNSCTGCSACLLSCQAENNVPVVGKLEVERQREMHWMRLDRYFEEEGEQTKVHYQPVMCAQCDNASCESVCPVLATVHSSEGLNMQVYNRCVGTRYCANNCPFKVRRFNWFEYERTDPMANLAHIPAVTVRTRGVMEKCTFCVQRMEEKKILARNEGRAVQDGEIETACQQSCPARAITFGDLVDLKSRVNRLKHDERDYILLAELNLRPAISYLAKVRNIQTEEA